MSLPSNQSGTCDLPRYIIWEGKTHEMVFRQIPAGSFRMGSRGSRLSFEEPRHWVEITKPFWMAETTVTQAQYQFMAEQCRDRLEGIKESKGITPSDFKELPDHPVIEVGWLEARLIGVWLSEQKHLLPDRLEARLPTEAEWEYACRAGTEAEYSSGDGVEALKTVGWFGENSGATIHKVREKGPEGANAFGLYDMHGNVWEWCLDAWDETAYSKRVAGEKDPFVPGSDASPRATRGGSCVISARICRTAFRDRRERGRGGILLGFRLCLSSGPVKNKHAVVEATAQAVEPVKGAGAGGPREEATEAGGAQSEDFVSLEPPRSQI